MLIIPPYFNMRTYRICFPNFEKNIRIIWDWGIKINNYMKIRIHRKNKNYSSNNSLLRYVAVASVIFTLTNEPNLTLSTITGI